jgi:hypothetical protein
VASLEDGQARQQPRRQGRIARVVIIDRAEKTMESRLEPQRKLPESTAHTREIRRKRILVGTKKLTTDQRA